MNTVILKKNIIKIEQDGEGLVPLIEQGKLNSPELFELLSKYLKPMLNFNIDHLVLGCTHYPYLIPQIQDILGEQVKIIDSGEAVAKQTKAILEKQDISNTSTSIANHQLYINSNKTVLEQILKDTPAKFTISELDF